MPGLFGFASLSLAPIEDRDAASRLFEEMASRLSHTGEEEIDLWADFDRGVILGRVRRPASGGPPWPVEVEGASDGPQIFIEGFLHDSIQASGFGASSTGQRTDALLKSLRGSYALAILQSRPARRLILAVDRIASRPLFWAVVRDQLIFAPELKALLAVKELSRELDLAAVGVFLGGGHLLADQTLLRSISRLQGGRLLLLENGRLRQEGYFTYRLSEHGDGTSISDLTAELGDELRGAVGRNYQAPEKTMIFLSGGIDSRAILGAAMSAFPDRLQEIQTICWSGGRRGPGTDVDIASQMSRAFGLKHRAVTRSLDAYERRVAWLTFLTEARSDIPAFHPSEFQIIADLRSTGIDRVIRGDEPFECRNASVDHWDALAEYGVKSIHGQSRFQSLLRSSVFSKVAEASLSSLESVIRRHSPSHPDDFKQEVYLTHRIPSYLNASAYFKEVLVDHRNPLLDESILNIVARTPLAFRRNKRLLKRTVNETFPELARIPIATESRLEDFASLISTPSPVRAAVEKALLDRGSAIWNLFEPTAVWNWFQSLGSATDSSAFGGWKVGRSAKDLISSVPYVGRRIRRSYRLRSLAAEDFFLRFLVVKYFVDLFILADGGSEVRERLLRGVQADL